ncbi:hypothetical protein [Streptomyces sp. YGL11-2]|uniref:hypothetical protein n=1 Tax=Streptomyces sp. YGL11-2 TaxID=3414028 RepID=UPI003CF2E8ED
MDRYESADEPPTWFARALVTAAMDASRLGWHGPLLDGSLRDAAPGYLDDEQRTAADPTGSPPLSMTPACRSSVLPRPWSLPPSPGGMGAQPGVYRLAD